MDAVVRAELDDIGSMTVNWRDDYISLLRPGHDHLVKDFSGELNRHIMPYLRRMISCGLVTTEEAADFWGECVDRVLELRAEFEKLPGDEPQEEMRTTYGAE